MRRQSNEEDDEKSHWQSIDFPPLVTFLGFRNGMSSSVPSFSHLFIYLLRHFPRQILRENVLEFSTPETHCWLTLLGETKLNDGRLHNTWKLILHNYSVMLPM